MPSEKRAKACDPEKTFSWVLSATKRQRRSIPLRISVGPGIRKMCSRLRLAIKKPPVFAGGLHKNLVFEKMGGGKLTFHRSLGLLL